MRPCACVCTRAHVCALMHTYTINSCMDSFPSTQFCELLNSTSDGCFPQFKHQHNERRRPLIQAFVCACVRACMRVCADMLCPSIVPEAFEMPKAASSPQTWLLLLSVW
jgi:hypothetical protein